MSLSSTIEWTDATWNPVRGCTKISPGCKHCYAEVFAKRFEGVIGHPYEQGFNLRMVSKNLDLPLTWRKPKKIFVNSMSDLFHPLVSDDYIEDIANVMVRANWHQFQVLTKRAERLAHLLNTKLHFATQSKHIWWGVSVEDKEYGLPRIDHLRRTPASVKFISAEPLLESLGIVDLRSIDWVIVGGESGRFARTMEAAWVHSLLAQCREQEVAFFFKQWGGTNKKIAGRLLNGQTYDELPILQ